MENKKIILITEDQAPLRNILREKLDSEGFSTLEASDGEKGLELALKEHPDLIILDILLPKMNGMEMLKKLREDIWGKTAKVIILTNLTDGQTMSNVMDEEVFDYFVKTDIKLEDFVKKIKVKLGLLES
jgi:two-component system response regulator VicR